MLTYPLHLERDTNGTWLVTVPDLPEAVTFGGDEAEAMERARDVIEVCLAEYVARRLPLPSPSPAKKGARRVSVSPLVEMKLSIYEGMRKQDIGKAELARRLNCHLPQVDRLLDLHHASRLDQIEAALRALGKGLVIRVVDAA
jgi:antitoxin HicB